MTADDQAAMGQLPGGEGPAQSEQERKRYAWLYDDEDIWGADGAPPVIYGDDQPGPSA